ncbi:MAG: antitoxin [Acidimicrobiia bacterium]
MGLFDRFKRAKDKAGDLVEEHGDKVESGIDKAADFADDKTRGKYSKHIDKGADTAKDAIEKLDDN